MKTRLILLMSITCLWHYTHAQVGNVGINTDTPLALLHVNDSSVLFTGPSTLPGNPGPPPVSGFGSRMMWYADKAAFRAGYVFTTTWDRDSIGRYSFAAGLNSLAKGEGSIALGGHTRALGFNAFAAGNGSIASGWAATSLGYYTVASGSSSTAIGGFTRATALGSFAAGWDSEAAGEDATALNTRTMANGYSSIALGSHTIANGTACLSIGAYNDPLVFAVPGALYIPETPLLVVGNGSGENARQNAMVVRYDGKIGIGTSNPAHRLEVSDPAQNSQIARFRSGGGYGEINVSNNIATVDVGVNNAYGYVGTKDQADFYFRSNAINRMVVKDSTGNVGIGTFDPASQLHVYMPGPNQIVSRFSNSGGYGEVNIDNGIGLVDFGVSESNGYVGTKYLGDFQIRAAGVPHVVVKATTGSVGIGTSNPSARLEVNGSAMKPGGGSWTATSDARLKQNINPYKVGLEAILAIRPVSYQYNALSGMNTEETHVGVIAQELQAVAPDMVSVSQKVYEDGSTGYLQVDNSAMTYMLINAVKELSARVDAQQQIIDELMQQFKEKSR